MILVFKLEITAHASGIWCRQHTEANCLGKCLESEELAMGMTPSLLPSLP